MPKKKTVEQYWTEATAKRLVGRKIVAVRYLSTKEAEDLGWYNRGIVLELDNGLLVYPSRDDEGNGAGALFTTDSGFNTIPVIDMNAGSRQMPQV